MTTALMRRMHARGASTIAALSSGESALRTRRRLSLLRGRFGAADERNGLWRLRFAPEWLDLSKLPRGGRVFDETPSVLDVARESDFDMPLFSETQTRGRGRRGRRWLSVPAGAILFAMKIRRPKSPLGLPLAVGVGILRALESDVDDALRLKWPNDILDSAGRKVGGVLAEMLGDSAVIGAGVNVLMTDELRSALGRPAAGLVSRLDAPQRRNFRASAVANAAMDAAAEFERAGVKHFLHDALSRHIAGVGEEIFFHGGDGRMRRGEFAGFGERGELLLRGKDGIEAHISGEFAEDGGRA